MQNPAKGENMYKKVSKWLDGVLCSEIPENVVAFCFNLYEDGDGDWSMELVGTSTFDENDEDWPCDEADDFGTREAPFEWHENISWENILEKAKEWVKTYIDQGAYANILKSRKGVGVGFVDGDLEIVYVKE